MSEWYALRVRPRFEPVAAFYLQSRNIEHYLPLRRVTRQLARGTRSIELPLLPGYVFCKTSPRMRSSLLTIPGVLHIAAHAISDQKISELKGVIQTGLDIIPTGKTVIIFGTARKSVTSIPGLSADVTAAIGDVQPPAA